MKAQAESTVISLTHVLHRSNIATIASTHDSVNKLLIMHDIFSILFCICTTCNY